MKRHLLIILLIIPLVTTFSQTKEDQEAILQSCVDLSELQPYLVNSDEEQLEQVYIKANDNFLSYDLNVIKFENPVSIVDKLELTTLGISYYINFFIFDVGEQNARVDFTYYGVNNNLWIYAEFIKDGTNWEISNLSTKEK